MADRIHTFSVQCTGCGNLVQQTSFRMTLRDQLKTGHQIVHYCSNCGRKWPADYATRGFLRANSV